MTLPNKLYHAAPECVLLDINKDGLKSSWGEIYAADSPADALTFMWFRLLDHPHISEAGMKMVAHDEIHIWEIDTSKTDAALWEVGTDHSTKFFGAASSWVYSSKEIERGSLTGCLVYTRKDIETALANA